MADYEKLLELDPSVFQKYLVYNNLAFILATSPDEKLRWKASGRISCEGGSVGAAPGIGDARYVGCRLCRNGRFR